MFERWRQYRKRKALEKARKTLLALNLHNHRMPSLVASSRDWENYYLGKAAIQHHERRLEREIKQLETQ